MGIESVGVARGRETLKTNEGIWQEVEAAGNKRAKVAVSRRVF